MLIGAVLLVVGAYILGTFPTAQLVSARLGHDPTREGSRNPGATNVYRVAGRSAGLLVLLGDIAKGAAPTALGLALGGRPLASWCWAAAVLGHVLPLHRRLRGGKGVATAGGGALVLHPLVAVVLLVVFAVVVRVGGRASVGSLTMAVGLPLLVLAERRSGWEVLVAAAIALVVVLRHRANIRRLVAHEEPAYRPG